MVGLWRAMLGRLTSSSELNTNVEIPMKPITPQEIFRKEGQEFKAKIRQEYKPLPMLVSKSDARSNRETQVLSESDCIFTDRGDETSSLRKRN